jgi:DNA mismatch repair ATPase MutS
MVYEYDAFLSVVKTAELYDLIYPEILPETENVLDIEDLKHLFVDKAVGNDVHFDRSANLLFISGPNMAGKSTFLKALGVAVYLAHAGLPVPAKRMKLNVLSGLCTTINISDNLNSGYSHFYAEVMRIKDVATRLKTNKNMLVLFDELFRGTNVKDAYDGTLAIVSAFAQIRTSFFVISSHIVEVTNELQGKENIKFSYFEIEQQDGHPVYTYKLKDGVTDVRLGMYIIKKEGVIELINEINKSI